MKPSRLVYLFFALHFLSCNIFKKSSKVTNGEDSYQSISLDSLAAAEFNFDKHSGSYPYRPSGTRRNDLLHTRLELKFDYAKQHVHGKATLTFRPWFYPMSTLELDAKGFDIHRLGLVKPGGTIDSLPFEYDGMMLKIQLDRAYTRNETYKIYLDYTAKPNEAPPGIGNAITEDKGLYFINPEGKEYGKPRQIWTQGETQSSSRWFPTIDAPNEKMTQEIYLTVDSADETLSNGLLMYSTKNNDGTRTDLWKMDLPHSPYLAMIAVGNFAVVKDSWRDSVDVNYYVEPEYERFARMIFGNTPEMMEFFSRKLGLDFVWPKYSQIVVRDFVSGAMENTTAVTFFAKMQHDSLQHLDDTYENIISHELFHHWFGDLVTAESWSNLSLNESFATYGEYLWNDYKYGRDQADFGLQEDYHAYLNSFNGSFGEQPTIINYHYSNDDKMFNAHTYQKGGRVLHMLRKYAGDEAFFLALRRYLDKYKFNTAELSNLRMEFEEITGEDLNWFFNQWFLRSGHPDIYVSYSWDSVRQEMNVYTTQNQTGHPYVLPVDIDIFTAGSSMRKQLRMTSKIQEFVLKMPSRPLLVNFDPGKVLLASIHFDKSIEEWTYQFEHAPLYVDRLEAMEGINRLQSGSDDPGSNVVRVINASLHDGFWAIRQQGLSMMYSYSDSMRRSIRPLLENLALHDPKPAVRADAIYANVLFNDSQTRELLLKVVRDSSYKVSGTALAALAAIYPADALNAARRSGNSHNSVLLVTIAGVFASSGEKDDAPFFGKAVLRAEVDDRRDIIRYYGDFLKRMPPEIAIENIKTLENIYMIFHDRDSRIAVMNVFLQLQEDNTNKITMAKSRTADAGVAEQKEAEARLLLLDLVNAELQNVIARLKNLD